MFFQVNVRTAMAVGQASGLAMAEAAAAGCDVVQYSPNEVKEAVAGYGAATKDEMERMVRTLLGIDRPAASGRRRRRRGLRALCHLAHAPRLAPARREATKR